MRSHLLHFFRQPRSDLHTRRNITVLVFVLVASVYLFTFGGKLVTIDEVAVETLSASLAKRGAIDSNRLLWTFNAMQLGPIVQRGVSGDYYFVKGPLTSVIAVPLYWLALHLPQLLPVPTILLSNVLVTALTAAVILRIGWQWNFSDTAATLAALAFAFSSLAWVYSKSLLTEPLTALCLAGAIFFLARSQLSLRHIVLGSLALTLAVINVFSTLPVVLLCGVYLIFRIWRDKDQQLKNLFAAALPAFIALGIWGSYNFVRFGEPWRTGYEFGQQGYGVFRWDSFSTALFGLTLSPYRGLVWFVPLSLLAPFGFEALKRRGQKAEALLLASAIGVTLIFHSAWSGWWSGQSWGSRYQVSIMPMLFLLLLPLFEKSRWRPISLIIALGGALIASVGAVFYYQPYEDFLGSQFQNLLIANAPLQAIPPLTQPSYFMLWGIFISSATPAPLLAWITPRGVDYTSVIILSFYILCTGILLARQFKRNDSPVWLNAPLILSQILIIGVIIPRYSENIATSSSYSSTVFTHVAKQSRPDDAIALMLTEHYFELGNLLRLNLPDYGFSLDTVILNSHSRDGLENLSGRAARVWVISENSPSADPQNQIDRWLAANAFIASEEWQDNLRITLYGLRSGSTDTTLVDAAFTNGIILTQIEVPAKSFHSNDTIPIALQWKVHAAPKTSLKVFIHLVDQNGTVVAQHDGFPVNGYRPTDGWLLDEYVRDLHGLLLPSHIPDGQYDLSIGLYNPQNGERVPLANGDSLRLNRAIIVKSSEAFIVKP